MNVSKDYDLWSDIYDSNVNRTRDLDAAVVRRQLGGKQFRSVVEIGCGTGKNTAFLATLADAVHAFDFSEGMLAIAREKVLDDHIVFEQLDVTQRWPCDDGAHDLVMCNLVLEHIQVLDGVFAEAYRVIESGGMFFISELHPAKQYLGSVARFEHEGQMVRVDAYTHHVSEFTSAGFGVGFKLVDLMESWHEEDEANGPPRLLTLVFRKS